MKILITFIIAVLLLLAFKIIRVGLKLLLNRYSGLIFLNNFMIAVEIAIWSAFLFWAIYLLFNEKFFYSYLVYALILISAAFLAWFLLRDIFAGIIFRLSYNLKNGSYIRAGNFSGQIKSQHLNYLQILTSDSQLLRIPYTRIVHEAISELAYPDSPDEHIIQIQVDSSIGKPGAAESLIMNAVMNTPWSNIKAEPTIKFLKENERGYFFEIMILSASREKMQYIKLALEEIPSLHVI